MNHTTIITAILTTATALTSTLHAENKTWDGGANTDSWHDDANWSPDGVPLVGDDVTISGSTVVVTHSDNILTTVNSITVQSNATLRHLGGTLTAANGLLVNSANFEFIDGILGNNNTIRNSDLTIGPDADYPAPFTIDGDSTLHGETHPNQVLTVLGNGTTGHAMLTIAGTINRGTIRLDSIDSSWNCELNIPSGGSFTNDTTGLVDVRLGAGGTRTLNGSLAWTFLNLGTIQVEENVELTQLDSTSTFEHWNGALDIDGQFIIAGGTLIHGGGAINGDCRVANGDIDVRDTALQSATIIATGNTTLLNHQAPNVTVWARGDNVNGAATLNAGDITIHGTVRLEAIDSSWNCKLNVPNGTSTILGPTGVVDVNAGTGGTRTIDGTLGWSFENQGLIVVETGTALQFLDSTSTFIQDSGMILADGPVTVSNGTLTYRGGTVSGELIVVNGSIDTRAEATANTIIQAHGSCDAVTLDAPNTEVWIRGNNSFGNASLNVAEVINRGRIRMESTDSSWNCELFVGNAATFINAPEGTIDVRLGLGGDRDVDGSLQWTWINQGSVIIDENTELSVVDSSSTTEFAGGSIEGLGRFNVISGDLVVHDADVTTPCSVTNGSIDVRDTLLNELTVIAQGTCDLVQLQSANATVWTQGNSQYGGATLNIPGLTNHGTIRLESIESSWNSRLRVTDGAVFTNGPSGHINARLGTGGNRDVTGTGTWSFINDGTITVDAEVDLEFTASGASTCRFRSGAVNGGGRVHANADLVRIEGGTIDVFEFASNDSDLEILALDEPATVVAQGSNVMLLAHNAPTVTVWVRGSGQYGSASLRMQDLTCLGRIRLESTDGGFTSRVDFVDDGTTLTLGETGRLDANEGSGGLREVDGNLINLGTVRAGYPNSLTVDGDYTQAASGTFLAEFAGETDTTYTRMDVTGNATIDGSIRIAREAGFVPTPGLNLNVLDALGELTGMFVDITSCDPINVVSDFDNDEVLVIFGEASDIPGDLTGDEIVNVDDLLILLSQWGACPDGQFDCCPGDLDESGTVDVNDLLLQLANWT